MIEIQWLGHACFRIKAREAIVVMDPYGPEAGYTLGRTTAHVVTVSHDAPDHNNVGVVKGLRGKPVLLAGPGEYEVGGVFVLGLRTYRDQRRGKVRGKNTVYVMEFAEATICHLGDLGHPLSDEELSEIGSPHILFVPVDGRHALLKPAQAAEVVGQIEPRLVIPMHHDFPPRRRKAEGVELFCQEMGIKVPEPLESLRLGVGDMPAEDDETRVVLLRPGVE